MISHLIKEFDRILWADGNYGKTEASLLLVAANIIQKYKGEVSNPANNKTTAMITAREDFATNSAEGKTSATDLTRGIQDFWELMEVSDEIKEIDREEILIAERDARAILNRNRIEKSDGTLNTERTFVPDDILNILQDPVIEYVEQDVIARALKRDHQFIEVKIVYPTIRALIIGLRARFEVRKAEAVKTEAE